MLPPVKVVDTADGKFLVFAGEDVINRHVSSGQRWEPISHAIAKTILQTGPRGARGTVVDAGANLGAFTIPLSHEAPAETMFHCFEVQRIVYYQLCGNIVLNQRQNIHAYNIGLGEKNGTMNVPVPDYAREPNIGAVSASEEIRRLRNSPTDQDCGKFDRVEFRTLDSFGFSDLLLLKVDVEGMELDVLHGAEDTLRRNNRPPLLLEVWKTAKLPQLAETTRRLIDHLSALGYSHQIADELCLAQVEGRPKLKLQWKDGAVLKLSWEQ